MNSVENYDKTYTHFLNRYCKIDSNLFLDIGCGWGALEVSLATRNGQVVGIEIDRDAIGLAKTLTCKHSVQDRISFIIADARRLPFRKEIFDGVVSFGTFEHIPRVELAIREAGRCLKNGGIFFFETPNRLFPYDLHDTNLFFIHWLPPRIANSIAYALHRIDPSHMRQTSRNFELNRYLTYWQVLKILNYKAEIVSSVGKFSSKTEAINHYTGWHRTFFVFFATVCDFFNVPLTPFLPVLSMVIKKQNTGR